MKKLMFPALALLTLSLCLYAQRQRFRLMPEELHQYYYQGSEDDTYWKDGSGYDKVTWQTTLGMLARRSDVIGVGQISDWADGRFTITVDHALVGCTNGVSIVVRETHYEPSIEYFYRNPNDYLPTNHSQIVFAAYTNDFQGGYRMYYWGSPEIPRQPDRVLPNYELRYLNRSWWYPERDDGVLFTQFTNVIQAVRFERNWTNFFYLCRDGATSTSNRVREDSYWDLLLLGVFATDEQVQFILADPLVDQKIKNNLLSGDWRAEVPDL